MTFPSSNEVFGGTGNLWGCQLPPACPSSRTSANGSLLWEGTFDVATMHPTSFLQGWKSCKSGDWWAWHSLVFLFPHVLFDKFWIIEGFLSFSINLKSDLHEADRSKANLNLGAFEARPGPRNTGFKKKYWSGSWRIRLKCLNPSRDSLQRLVFEAAPDGDDDFTFAQPL